MQNPLNPKNFWPGHNFAALDDDLASWDNARFVVIPVPYDSTTTWQGGTRDGGISIIDASMNMELYDRELGLEISECGIHTTSDLEPVMSSPEKMAVRVTETIGEVLFANKIPVMLGGEHSLTFGGVCAALKLDLPGKLTVVQLDAHTDLRQKYGDTRWGHGCVARRMSELPGVEIVQIGLRSTSQEEAESVPTNIKQFWAEDILADFPASLAKIMQYVGPDVYLTFDVDACDPSWVPSTGTPEPGGLGYYQVRDILKAVCTQRRVRALDCVELIGGHPASAFAIARLLYKAMGYISTSQPDQ
jgi:agmatinase